MVQRNEKVKEEQVGGERGRRRGEEKISINRRVWKESIGKREAKATVRMR